MTSETAVRESIRTLVEGVQIVGFDWTYLYLNEAAERHARRQGHELIGRRMMECYPGIDQTPMFAALQRVMRGRKSEQFVNDFVYPDGSQGWFELLIEPVPDGVCILSFDIGDKHRTVAQQRQAQTMEPVGLLAGGRAHDFSNVLTLLIPQVIDLNHAVLDLQAMITLLMGDQVRLLIETAPDLGHTRADPAQIEQILMNLVVNARDAMPYGGTVRISTANVRLDEQFALTHIGSAAGDYVALSVEDTGTGISPDILEHVFEPLFTTKGPGRGTGVGLPTVYEIVKQSGGYVAIDTTVGVGTTITTYLPLVAEPLSEAVPRAPLRSVNGNETVLILEADESARELMRKALLPHGYTILEARDVWDALTIACSRSAPIDLLLTDIVMPDMNGPQLAQQIVTMHPNVRVLYVSGVPQASILGSSTVSSRVAFLPKPFAPGALLAGVREALDAGSLS